MSNWLDREGSGEEGEEIEDEQDEEDDLKENKENKIPENETTPQCQSGATP